MRVLVTEKDFLIEGNSYSIKDELKEMGFKWNGDNWFTHRVDVAEQAAEKFDLKIESEIVEDFYTGYKTAEEFDFDYDIMQTKINKMMQHFRDNNPDLEFGDLSHDEFMKVLKKSFDLDELQKLANGKYYTYKQLLKDVKGKGKTSITIYDWRDNTFNIKNKLKKLNFRWDGSNWFKQNLTEKQAQEIIDSFDWTKYRFRWNTVIICG